MVAAGAAEESFRATKSLVKMQFATVVKMCGLVIGCTVSAAEIGEVGFYENSFVFGSTQRPVSLAVVVVELNQAPLVVIVRAMV